eukprot:GSMAST32.ASY1.ANO1.1539.1 assembled CDS
MMQRQLNPPSGDVGKKQNDSSALCNGPTFDDIAGMDEALTEVREIVDFLNNRILLIGPSGTGKTLLARSLAQEARVPFYSCSAYFVEILVGRGAARVRDLFQRATDSSGGLNSNDEREQTLNQLLTEMDGFDTRVDENGNKLDPIVIIAATNRPEVLDPALIRPGRFDRHVEIGLPNVVCREAILRVHSKNIRMDPNVSLRKSGAELAGIINDAALLAVRYGLEQVNSVCMQEATTRSNAYISHTKSKYKKTNWLL